MSLRAIFKLDIRKIILFLVIFFALFSYLIYSNLITITGLNCNGLKEYTNYCLAIKENNPDFCYNFYKASFSFLEGWRGCKSCGKNVTDPSGKNYTLICRNVAQDFSSCEILDSICYQYFTLIKAVKEDNSAICESIDSSDIKSTCLSKILNINDNELENKTEKDCSVIEDEYDRDGCYFDVAVSTRNKDLCNNVLDIKDSPFNNEDTKNVRQLCFAETTLNENLCETFSFEDKDYFKMVCYYYMGYKKDSNLCNKLDSGLLRALCFYKIKYEFSVPIG